MTLDVHTLRNLEILINKRTGKELGTLYSVVNRTNTSVGARLLRATLCTPLSDRYVGKALVGERARRSEGSVSHTPGTPHASQGQHRGQA